jgi:hypothetical protein
MQPQLQQIGATVDSRVVYYEVMFLSTCTMQCELVWLNVLSFEAGQRLPSPGIVCASVV